MNILLILVPIITIIVSATIAVKKKLSGVRAKKAFRYNAIAFLVVLTMLIVFAVGSFAAGSDNDAAAAQTTTASAQAEETAEESAQSSTGFDKGMAYLAAGLSTGLAGIGGGIAVAAGAPAAIGAVSEDPKAFGKAIIFVALGESIALYGVVISILVLPR